LKHLKNFSQKLKIPRKIKKIIDKLRKLSICSDIHSQEAGTKI